MKYDFTSIMERHGMDAIAVDNLGWGSFYPEPPKEGFDSIPMWVADMNFPTVPTVVKAMADRVQHPAYGYFKPRAEYFEEIIEWQRRQHGVQGLTKECIGYENGVLGGVVTALNIFCCRGDNVLVHAPTYTGFTKCLKNNGYNIVLSYLKQDEQGVWRMDLADMEQKIVENKIHACVFCSPHNPCGRVWTREELEPMMELFRKYSVQVVSDEIWADLTLYGNKHIPTQSVSEDAKMRTIALYAPSKTFNLAGLVGSYSIIYNPTLRDKAYKESSLGHYNSMNVLSMYALIGAYKEEGYEWLEELRQVLAGNVDYACSYIAEHFPGVTTTKPEGTYMLFIDCTQWCKDHGKDLDWVKKAGWDVGVDWQDGRDFHGPCHIRLNLALPLSRVKEAFARMDRYVFNADKYQQ